MCTILEKFKTFFSFKKKNKKHYKLSNPKYSSIKVKKVSDFTEPRYVYSTSKESVIYDPSLGEVIGIRISNDLVLHECAHSGGNWPIDNAIASIRYHNAELLDEMTELPLLRKYFKQISKMRVTCGYKPLPQGYFWVINGNVCRLQDTASPSTHENYFDCGNVIMKRTNLDD